MTMPKFLEDRLAASAKRKGFHGERAKRYIYGAMNNKGLMRGNKITAKGEALERKHNRDKRSTSRRSRRSRRY